MKPLILLYSETNEKNISERMGLPEYSYYFVLKWFTPILKEIGDVKVIYSPKVEADEIYLECKQVGRPCVLLSFSAPHCTLLPEYCPTIPVVAWEFERIPDHQWDENPFSDWRALFQKTGMAITHSEFAKQAIQRAMPEGFPVWSIPAPVWDRFHAWGQQLNRGQRTPGQGLDVTIHGAMFDSANHISSDPQAQWLVLPPPPPPPPVEPPPPPAIDPVLERKLKRKARRKRSLEKLLARLSGKSRAAVLAVEPAPAPAPPPLPPPPPPSPTDHIERRLSAKGVVFASVLNSRDGRKNWVDLITAFASEFQNTPDAVLIFKLNDPDSHRSFMDLEHELKRFIWLKCRIIAFNGYLPDDDYKRFLSSVDYIVNASSGEGQCLPLMELMSMGTPAIAPDHTSMADYINSDNAVILPSTQYLSGWPHDPRYVYSTLAYKTPWDALRDSYGVAYEIAKNDHATYQRMSQNAAAQLENHCSSDRALDLLIQALRFRLADSLQ